MLPLRCGAQNYEWGRPAACSEVAQLAQASGHSVDDNKPYAELWMGTHPNCPSVVATSGTPLQQWLQDHPEALGSKVTNYWGSRLPFLFKVLSVNKALSIQSHPDKALAERLREQFPKLYPDDNHKPEMALALSEFEALCSFLPTIDLQQQLRTVPELAKALGEPHTRALLAAQEADPQTLRAAFTALMTQDPDVINVLVSELTERLQHESHNRSLTAKERIALRLQQQYPGDVGVLSSFFLNLITLQPGEAIYLPANEPHAYLSGEIMECMAASDNVIRAGLTPKYKHTEVLCETLTYSQGMPEVLSGTPVAQHVRTYRPPFEEFEIQHIFVPAGSQLDVPVNDGPRILVVQHGSASASAECSISSSDLLRNAELHRGSILFVPAGAQLHLSVAEDLVIWAAACNGNFFSLQAIRESAAAVPAPKSLQSAMST